MSSGGTGAAANVTRPDALPGKMSTFHSDSSHSSTSSAKYHLDQESQKEILVFKLRAGTEFMSQSKLCKELDKDVRWRCSKKPIPRGCSRVDIKVADLFNEPERSQYKHYPNQTSSVASVGLPRSVYWRRMLFGHFSDLYIVSPESSPSSSPEASQAGSQSGSEPGSTTPSPSATWQHGAQE